MSVNSHINFFCTSMLCSCVLYSVILKDLERMLHVKRRFFAAVILLFSFTISAYAQEPGGVYSIVGTGGHGADIYPAQFNMPLSLAVDPGGGVIYVADTYNNVIRELQLIPALHQPRVNILAGYVEPEGPDGFPMGFFRNCILELSRFNRPSGIAVNQQGWIFVADTYNHAIRVIMGRWVYTIAGGAGQGFADGNRFSARFSYPGAITICPLGNIYVADTGNHAIRRVDLNGNVTTVAGRPGVQGYANGAAAMSLFDSPKGLAVSSAGRLYIADTGNHAIRTLHGGVVSTFAGARLFREPELVFGDWYNLPIGGFANGQRELALFNNPIGLAFWNDMLIIADSSNHMIRGINAQGIAFTIAGTGYAGYDGQNLRNATFHFPSGVYVFENTLLVADTGNNMIRAINLELTGG